MPARASTPRRDDTVRDWLEQTVGTVDFLAHVDRELRFLYVSDASLRFIGYHRDYLHTLTLRDLIAEQDTATLEGLLARAARSGQVEKATMCIVKSLTYPLDVEVRAFKSRHHGVDGFAIAAFDVSAWRALEARLTYEMHHDPMTGLDNLSALVPALMRAQQAADEAGTCAALLLLDLDDYQRINRALGYDAGDALLRETAQRLQALVTPGEQLARVASDKFAVVFTASDRSRGSDAADSLARRLQAAVREPYVYQGQTVHLSASIGIALYPDERAASHRAQHHSPLLRRADHALAQAKASGGNTLAFHAPVDDPADAERLKLEADLYDGVRNGEFSLHFQPITRSQSGAVVGVEALIRWRHPVHGLVPPATFIPLAESIGLINYLGNWVLKAACMQLVAWDRQGLALQYVAVNVSPQQFRDPRFAQSVREAMTLTGIDPHRIVLEITESLLMHDPVKAKGLLEELTEMGIRFAIDDFGTGYSSLAYLQRFPLAKLKIDRSFVENLLTSRNDRAIVSAVVGLAQTLDLELVAEGVETEAQRALLTEMGCNHIQGWLVCQALPSEELARRFEAQQLRLHAA
ncbi:MULTISPECIES: cyclic di-GMP phosphodiesterase CdpA [Burkholderia]|uniref:Cyclic di-GMP phosphodiesterase CdpA n=1 Tax=Burkholderia anthina TaxID=179879 RepID=A0A7T7AIR3_9BURK|nr:MULTISPECIES: cyclic di-GMP phosphodiesterase CdpA [Burkholderia]MBY4869956.1 cyclic di-GMP phosphodiesterase CdpA [Burkholderia anthina]QQK04156.1 cyclic di-GMP phosphodiesterase CdpA [Burkholderia anthina]